MTIRKTGYVWALPVVILFVTATASGLMLKKNRGDWPTTWPKELEPLRDTATTYQMMTGTHEDMHVITFKDRSTFEQAWPAILKVRSPHSPLTLHRTKSDSKSNTKNTTPKVRILTPSRGYSKLSKLVKPSLTNVGSGTITQRDMMLALMGLNRSLPEYVTATRTDDGEMQVQAVSRDARPSGFKFRARVDIHLVVDGKVIDLNRIRLPKNVTVIDRRFDDESD